MKLENLTLMKITKFANTLPKKSNGRGGTLSPTTIGDIRCTLSAMLETAVQQGLMPNNPSKAAQWPSAECAPGKAATPEEMGRFLAALENERWSGRRCSCCWPRPACAAAKRLAWTGMPSIWNEE